jgi:uracil-DNA glycosylase
MCDTLLMSNGFPENLPERWKMLLAEEAKKEYFAELTSFLREEQNKKQVVFPARDRILRALQELDYDKVKVVILGQDPYHGEGQAVGLSFAVPNELRPKPPSLMNIFKEIRADLQKEIDPTKSELTSWVSQGVLLLNTVLTVRQAQAFSHRERGWEHFTDKIISLLNERIDPVVFILWGSPSRKKKALITNQQHHILESAHPSPLSAHHGFLGSKPFSNTNKILTRLGKSTINWEITT